MCTETTNHVDNILSCGYIREYESKNKMLIPNTIQNIIVVYCKQYNISGIGCNHNSLQSLNKLICNTNDIFVNGYGLNIKSISDELYIYSDNNLCSLKSVHMPTIPDTIKHTSSGIANDNDLFIYTVNHQLYKTTMQSENIDTNISSEFVRLNTSCIEKHSDTIIDIKCGLNHTLLLTQLGNVYSIGINDVGQCGLDKNLYPTIQSPQLIMSYIEAIACGCFHSLFINDKQQLIVCGYNYNGQLGIDVKHEETFIISGNISDNDDESIVFAEWIDDEETHTTNSDNEALCGSFEMVSDSDSDIENESDWAGTDNLCIDKPVLNDYFMDLNIEINKIYAGKFHSLCITSNGKCYAFGFNVFGNLGNGEINDWGKSNYMPQEIKIDKLDMKFIDGSCGENHSLLLSNKNDIVAFGDNTNNQCSIVNKNKIIEDPIILNKQQEFGYSNCFIEKVICLKNESLVFIDVYKR